ncbi:DUF262 domain-containing protein [Candidatus Clostridium radicumherbarum]|uniref:DUF262 domain-containing protein n=1 Tax=Candidatus Clostridium radicumherbarum TaxID=3381662 RepID=A0ABW8TUU1_9CLOT
MKINKKLISASSFNPTKKTFQMTVSEMNEKIDVQEFSLPLYQRDISWTVQKSIDLFNYQLLGKAPVSPISINVINNTDDCVPQVSFVERELINNIVRGQFSVADGQQRLTTNYKAYIHHDDFRNVVLDLAKGQFTQAEDAIKKHQIPVGVLLNKEDNVLFKYINKSSVLKDPEVMSLLVQIRSKMKNYNYTINQAEDLNEDEQIEWFEVLNNAGSRVSILQMRFSKLKAHGIDIYVQYTSKFKERLKDLGYDFFVPQKTGVSYPVATLNSAYEVITGRRHTDGYTPIPSDTKENQLCNLDPEELTKCFKMTLDALDMALEFIEDNNLKEPDRIDYITYLTGYFVFNSEGIDESNKAELIDWYNKVDFTNKSNTERREIFSRLILMGDQTGYLLADCQDSVS